MGVQTWVEGVPVKAKSAKPAKPTKAAALQILRQLALQHCTAAQTDVFTMPQPADSALDSSEMSSQPNSDQAHLSGKVQPELIQCELALTQLDDAASNSIQSDTAAEADLRGGIAVDADDDGQAPAAVSADCVLFPAEDCSAEDAAEASSSVSSSSVSSSCVSSLAKVEAQAALAVAPDGTAITDGPAMRSSSRQRRPQSLSRLIQQQRRRMSQSQSLAASQPDVVLALTDAQQQQLQLESAKHTCSSHNASDAAATDDFDSVTSPSAAPCQQEVSQQSAADSQMQADGQRSSRDQALVKESVIEAPGEEKLWQKVTEALQDVQASHKLAHLTVTLLARM